jgi:signal transduction histidine kinase
LTDVDLVAVVHAVVERLERALSHGGCALEMRAPASVVGRWDPERLDYVVMSILFNAIKFGAGRPIEIRIDVNDGRAVLAVTDHGIGIPADALPHIFEKFSRAVSSRHYGGLGLGLYIARHIVEALGGSVRAESVRDAFTTITVELPVAAPCPREPRREPQGSPSRRPGPQPLPASFLNRRSRSYVPEDRGASCLVPVTPVTSYT